MYLAENAVRYEKKVGLDLPCGYDQGAFSSGHELADGTLCELAADFREVELERRVGERDLHQRGLDPCCSGSVSDRSRHGVRAQ